MLVLAPAIVVVNASPGARAQPVTLDEAQRAHVIDGTLAALRERYVFPETAREMECAIRARQQRRDYDAIDDPRMFAYVLTRDLRSVSQDLHLRVDYSRAPATETAMPSNVAPPISLEDAKRFGFERVERLAGGIGYVDLRRFASDAGVADAVATVMTYLSSSDAVIIDLRRNAGGEPDTVALITSYLFGEEPVHLYDFVDRTGQTTRSSWTLPTVAGARLADKPVYVLTSNQTFSGGEAFAYSLKALKRTSIVGERTAGAAHTVEPPRRLDDDFLVIVPSGRPINVVTKADWEGVGVEPDVHVPVYDALPAAHELALRALGRELAPEQLGLPGGERWLHAHEPPALPTPAATFRGDFESGGLEAWTSVGIGAGDWFAYTDGELVLGPQQTDPNTPFELPRAPQGEFAAITAMNGPGVLVLYQDIVLDRPYVLSATVFYESDGALASPQTLNATDEPNQQYRIDLVQPMAPIESLQKAPSGKVSM